MGSGLSIFQEQTQRSFSPVDILGEDTTVRGEELSQEEVSQLMEMNDIFETFYKEPTSENYNRITGLEGAYQKALGQRYQLYVWAIRSLYGLGEPMSEEEELDYTLELDRLLDERNFLTAADLDKLWTLYYATGKREYPERIKQIARNPLCHQLVRGAANWSYSSHVQSGKLIDPDWKCSDGTREVVDYIVDKSFA